MEPKRTRSGLVGVVGAPEAGPLRHWVSIDVTEEAVEAEDIANRALARFEGVGATVQGFNVSAVSDPTYGLQFVIIVSYVYVRHLPLRGE